MSRPGVSSSDDDSTFKRDDQQQANNQRNQANSQKSDATQDQLINDVLVVDTSQLGGEYSKHNGTQPRDANCQQQTPSVNEVNGKQPASKSTAHESAGKRNANDNAGKSATADNRYAGNDNQNEQQRNVWNYLLQQQEPPNRIHSEPRPSLSDYEEDDTYNDDSHDYDDDLAQQSQMINFKEKLTAFERLAKHPPPPEPIEPRSRMANGSAAFNKRPPPLEQRTAAVGEEAQAPKPKPPAVNDLMQRENGNKHHVPRSHNQVYGNGTSGLQQPPRQQLAAGHVNQSGVVQQPSDYDLQMDHISGRLARSQISGSGAVEHQHTTGLQQPHYNSHNSSQSHGYPIAASHSVAAQPHRHQPAANNGGYYHHDQQQLYANQPYVHDPTAPQPQRTAFDQQQYFVLDEFGPPVGQASHPVPQQPQQQEPLYVNNQQAEQLQYMQQQQQQQMKTYNGGMQNGQYSGNNVSPSFNQQLYYPKPYTHNKQQPPQVSWRSR